MSPQAALGFALVISIIVGLFSSRLWMAVIGGLIVGVIQAALVVAFSTDLLGLDTASAFKMRSSSFVAYAGLDALLCAVFALSAHTFRRGIAGLFRRRQRPSA